MDGKYTPPLQELIDYARTVEMTPAELQEQRISFAYGNIAIENPNITRDMVVAVAREIDSCA